MELFEFDRLDEPMECDGPAQQGSKDTQTLHFRRCDVCGVRLFFNAYERPPDTCPACDDTRITVIADLLAKGRRMPVK